MILTAENYYSQQANLQYMSVSQFKSFQKCEAAAMAELDGKWENPETTALLVGSYIDAYFDGRLDLFRAAHPKLFKKDGTLKTDFKQAEQIISRITNDTVFMSYVSGNKQVIMTAKLFGCYWKIKIDSYDSNRITDLKIMRSLEPVMGMSFIEYWNYDVQIAVYTEVERIASGRAHRLPGYLAVATKEDFTDLEVISIPEWKIDECLGWVEKELPHILSVKNGEQQIERCGVCDFCKKTKILTGPIDFQDVGISRKELRRMRGEY